MTAGSVNLRTYRIARRDGADRESAAMLADITSAEAKLIDRDDERDPPGLECFEPIRAVIGHNSQEKTMVDNVAADQLRLFIERIERLEEEKRGISDDIKDIYLEAKSQGYDPKIMRIIVRDRRMDKQMRDERDAILETYRAALGMLSDTPLGAYALSRAA
jgi:uncharacterized protein (UPF0335 family)